MVSTTKIKNSFKNVRRDMDALRYDTSNNLRFLNVKVKEQGIRIKELERRLAQLERLSIRETLVR